MSSLAPIHRPLVRDQVANAIREQLLSGELEPGSPIRENDIAERLQVSRNPVREALIRLEQEGLLVSSGPQRGHRVLAPDLDYLTDLYDFRGLLEGHAAELVANHNTDVDLDGLRRLAAEMGAAYEKGELNQLVRLDMSFHEVFVVASGNAMLIDSWRRIWNLNLFVTNFTVGRIYDAVAGIDRAHLKLLGPIEQGDPDQARVVAREHVARFLRLFQENRPDMA